MQRFCITILFIFLLILLSIQVFFYVNQEHALYSWDYGRSLLILEALCSLISQKGAGVIVDIYNDLQIATYNVSSVIPLIPFQYLNLDARSSFVFGVIVCYHLPAVYLMYRVFLTLNFFQNIYFKVTFICIAAGFPLLLTPGFRGYPDIVGLLPVLLAMLIVLGNDLTRRIDLKKMLAVGFLLYLSFLLRRWYAYTVFGLYISLPLLNYMLFTQGKFILDRRRVYVLAGNFFVAGCVSVIALLVLQFDLMVEILKSNYKTTYSGYYLGMGKAVEKLISATGIYILPFLLLGIIRCVFTKNIKVKVWGIFCLFNMVLSFVLLCRVVTPYTHQLLPTGMWILFLSFLGLELVLNFLKDKKLKNVILVLCIVTSFFITFVSFNRINGNEVAVWKFLPEKTTPLHTNHLDSYYTLVEKLKNDKKEFAVLSSGLLFNEDLIKALSDDDTLPIYHIPQIDSYDYLKLDIFRLPYLVVSDPVLVHLSEQTQRVIVIPGQTLLLQNSIGKAYQRLPQTYLLDNNAKAYIYEKKRPFSLDEVRGFIQQFMHYYPSWEALYAHPITDLYLTCSFTGEKNNILYIDKRQANGVPLIYLNLTPHSTAEAEFGESQGVIVFQLQSDSLNQTGSIMVTLKNAKGETVEFSLDKGRQYLVEKEFSEHFPTQVHIKNISLEETANLVVSFHQD